ncbi:MAG TPA: Smr/MutS family protein [Anaeromyxobacteraceae bacterium]
MEHRLLIDGTLDLHAFRPDEAADVVAEYLEACHAAGILAVRIVHERRARSGRAHRGRGCGCRSPPRGSIRAGSS